MARFCGVSVLAAMTAVQLVSFCSGDTPVAAAH